MSDSALHGRLIQISHNDGTTPSVGYEYRRDGSVAAIDDAAGLRVMSDWSAQGRAQREVIGASQLQDRPDLLVGLQWQQPLDALGRRAGHSGQFAHSGIALELPSATWDYDAATGRFSSVQSGGLTASWAWSHTATQSTRTLTRSSSASQAQPSLTSVQEQNLGRGLFKHIHSRSGTVIQSRTRGTLANSHQIDYRDPHFGVVGGANEMSTWIYGSDPRGQITSARKRLDATAGAPFAPGWDASYAYDDLGNRITWGQGSAQQTDLSDLEPTSYSRNALHQYTAISGVNASRVTGQAPASQEVKINGVTAERAGHFYHRRVQDGARSDLTLPHWLEVTVTATTTLPNAQTVTAQRAGSIWQPPIPEEPVYDFDGSLIEDGRWLYTWDAENRLIQMLTRPAAVAAGAPNWRLSFAYDHQSRRIQKKVEVLTGGVWEVRSDARFIYDGWNVVAEVELNGAAWDAPGGTSAMDPRPAYVRRSWVWGEDVSGTLDGAGGVGGLLVVIRHARGGQGRESYWAMSDLNGNVTGLVSTTSGRMAVYEYDAFGRLLRENEPEPGLNPVRFSSKYQDVETGLVYYGYRYYSPEMGRWISRDPIEEQGGLNLFGMVGNDAVNHVDVLGKSTHRKIFNFNIFRAHSKLPVGGSRFIPTSPGAPAAIYLGNFWIRRNAKRTDILDISETRSLSDLARRVDNGYMKDYFDSTVRSHSSHTWAEASGSTAVEFINYQATVETDLWQLLTLRGWTLDMKITCNQVQSSCGGTCKADFQLYDDFDFEPNGTVDYVSYVFFEYIPKKIGAALPFYIMAKWKASYTFDENFQIKKVKNSVY